MATFASRWAPVVVASVAAIAALPHPAAAQSTLSADPYRTVVITAPSPYWGATYTPYVVRTPLDGVAAVIEAQGDYLDKVQKAALLREEVRQKKLETRRKQLEHWEWERDFRAATAQRERERIHNQELEYARNFPSQTMICDGTVLNKLLDELARRPELPADGSTRVEADWLAHVHVSVDGRANIALLKGDTIFWPQLLLRPEFSDDRKRIDDLLKEARQLAVSNSGGQVALAPVLRGLEEARRACKDHIDTEIRNSANDPAYNPRHYVEGGRFLKQLLDAIFMLERPDAAFYLTPLQGRTVGELVAQMKKKGVRFAPATVGCERFYVALHRALADEVTRLKGLETPPNSR
jgi:hypothetical protein